MPTIKEFAPYTPLDDEAFTKIEQAGGLEKLNAKQRRKIQKALENYYNDHWHLTAVSFTKSDRTALSKLANQLDKLIKHMRASEIIDLVFDYARIDRDEEITRLEKLHHYCIEYREHLSIHGSTDPVLGKLLCDLEPVFAEAGGGPAGVSHDSYADEKVRNSPFIKFVAAIIAQLPEAVRQGMRHEEQALASFWEPIFQGRKESLAIDAKTVAATIAANKLGKAARRK